MILLDTHTWIWFLSDPEMLSEQGKKAIAEAAAAKTVHVSSISVWEVALLVQKQRLDLSISLDDWLSRAQTLPFCAFIPVDNDIAVRSVRLPAPIHTDPADRMIIATAMKLNATIVTKDEKILGYPHITSIW
jgi:PIN domain nuclease of toxin-antitoxin system